MKFNLHTLDNGIRVLHLPDAMPIAYVGVAVDAGTRDELADESGMAHFVEHMLFKGTTHRRSFHIINWLESVGGQLDAFTTKEDTCFYATVPAVYTERAMDLLSDIVFNSQFPEHEVEKERVVVIDEIQCYNDSPAELIYDEFEQQIFPNDTIGRNILGTEQALETFDTERLKRFVKRCYTTDRMVLFAMGPISFEKFVKLAERYFSVPATKSESRRTPVSGYKPSKNRSKRDTFQAHCIMGNRCVDIASEKRLTLLLLNNILGGPNMSSRLNMAVRERHGLCYTIESNITNYTDTGVWNIYFGCDHANLAKAHRICVEQLNQLINTPITPSRLATAKLQLRGQTLIADQMKDNVVLAACKVILHGRTLHDNEYLLDKIDAITAEQLQEMAAETFSPNLLSELIYCE